MKKQTGIKLKFFEFSGTTLDKIPPNDNPANGGSPSGSDPGTCLVISKSNLHSSPLKYAVYLIQSVDEPLTVENRFIMAAFREIKDARIFCETFRVPSWNALLKKIQKMRDNNEYY
jgi:hypothetical protein